MGNETSQQYSSQSPSVIIITPEQVVLDRDNVSKLPDYTNRLKEIKERLKELEKMQCETIIKETKNTYPGDPKILQSLLPIVKEIEILSTERKIINLVTAPLEERVKITSKLYQLAIRETERNAAFESLAKDCSCKDCCKEKKTSKTNDSTVNNDTN